MAETISMPKLGFDMAEGTLVHWVIIEGQEITKGAVLAEIETDKATVEVESSAEGILYKHLVKEGDIVPVGTPIAIVAAPGEEVKDLPQAESTGAPAAEPAASQPAAAESAPAAPSAVLDGGRVKASPVARHMAQEQNVSLTNLSGTGPGGRIIKRDVEAALSAAPVAAKPVSAAPAAPAAASKTPAVNWVPGAPVPADEHIPMDKLRTIIGKRMVDSKTQVPHFYVTHEFNAAPVMKMRKDVNAQLPDDQKLSVNDFIVKAVALALRQFPGINASLAGTEIVRHGHVNVGVAVAMDSGLMTIVSKDADQKPLRVISQEVKEMVARARAGKVRTEDIEGSTFSISNLGMYDVEDFIAIINPPEAAILAVGSVKQVPVVENGEIKVGTRLKATISADHRVTDGAEAARFMQAVGEFLENPLRLLL